MAGLTLGVFGGTFDPPHVGHLILASEAQAQLGLDRVLWLLTPHPPHKSAQVVTPVQVRLELLSAALAGDTNFEISSVDIDRPAPHYAVDSMLLLHQKYPGAQLVYLMGGDSLADLPTWRNAAAFVRSCDAIGVMQRAGPRPDMGMLEQQLPGISSRLRWIQAPRLDISSRQIRQWLQQGRPCRYYLPPSVYQIIEAQHLYR